MSLVEKALEKVRLAGQQESSTARARAAPAKERGSSADLHPVVDEPFTAEKARRIVRMDEAALRAARVLPPEDEGRRIAEEFGAIKREIIGEAFAEGVTDSFERRLVAVSSALPGDGKTQTSVNLAFSIARERECSVVLIDGDVAKPHVSELLALTNEPGLLDLLESDDADARSALLPTDRTNFWVLPAGRRSEIATELLASQRMRHVCAQIARVMPRAILLLDSPPLLMTSEAGALVSIAGQVILVVKAGETPRQAVGEALARIDNQSRVKLVLNQTPVRRASYYNYGRWLLPGGQDQSTAKTMFGSQAPRG